MACFFKDLKNALSHWRRFCGRIQSQTIAALVKIHACFSQDFAIVSQNIGSTNQHACNVQSKQI